MVRSPLLYPPNVTWKTCVLLWRWRKTNMFDQPSSCCWADLPMVSRTTLRTKTRRILKIEKCLSMSNPANNCVGQMCWSELVACIMLEPTDKKQTFSFCNFTLFGEEKLSFDVPSPLPTTHKESWSVVGSTLSMIVKKYSTIRTKATKKQQWQQLQQWQQWQQWQQLQQWQQKQWSTFFLKRIWFETSATDDQRHAWQPEVCDGNDDCYCIVVWIFQSFRV